MRYALPCLICFASGFAAHAEPLRYTLQVKPAKDEPGPVRHPLLPTFREQTAGNAADHFRRAMAEREKLGKSIAANEATFTEALAKNPRQLPAELVGPYLDQHRAVFGELETAARCRECDWQLEERIDRDGANASMMEFIVSGRGVISALKFRIRHLLGQGKLDEALADIQTGLAVVRRTGEGPTLIVHICGMAATVNMLDEIVQVIQTPGAPNLYQALSQLPQPLLRRERVVDGELRFLETSGLRHVHHRVPTAEEAAKMLDELVAAEQLGARLEPDKAKLLPKTAGEMVRRNRVAARQSLGKLGFSEEKLNGMSASQIVAADMSLRLRRLHDDKLAVLRLPNDEAAEIIRRFESRPKDSPKNSDYVEDMLTSLEQYAVALRRAGFQLDRRVAMLRIIEAVRMDAAEHGGNVPKDLIGIAKRVSLPSDPATGKPFDYRLKDKTTFVLAAPRFDGQPASTFNSIEFTVTVQP